MAPRQTTFYADLVGNNFRDEEGKAAFALLETGHPVHLEPDFDNPYDENALAVYAVDDEGNMIAAAQLGFVDKFMAASIAQYYRAGWRFSAVVEDRRRGGEGFFKNGNPKPDKPMLRIDWDGADQLPPDDDMSVGMTDIDADE